MTATQIQPLSGMREHALRNLALVVPGGVVVPERAGVVRFMGHYRFAADFCKWVYLPLELMDRSVRPTAWKLAWEED